MRTRSFIRSAVVVVAITVLFPVMASGQQQSNAATDVQSLLRQAHDLAKSATTLDQFTNALKVCGSAARANPSEKQKSYIYQLSGWTYNKRGEALVKLAEDTAATDQTRAAEYEEAAIIDFKLAIRFDQKSWKPRFNHAVSVAMLGQYKEALADLDFVLREKPKHKNALFNRAEILLQLGEYDRAISDYSAAIDVDPNDGAAYAGRGIAYSAVGDTDNAMLDLNSVVRLKPDNAQAYVDRADLYAALGKWEMAAADYRVAIGLDDQIGRAYQNVAWLMATCPDERFRNPPLAVRAAKKAIELDGQSYLGLDTYAAALASVEKYADAAVVQRKAVQTAPATERADLQSRLALYQQSRPYVEQTSQIQIATKPDGLTR